MKPTQCPNPKRERPTVGVLAGWQAHAGTPDSFLHQVFRGIHAAARDQDCNLMLAYSIGAPRGTGLGRPAWPLLIEEADFVPVGPWNVDGLIIAPPIVASSKGAQYFQALQREGYPIVSAGAGLPGSSIVADNEQGIHEAMAHLLAHGHTRIAFVAGHRDRVDGDSGSRLMTYQTFLEEHGLPQDPGLIAYSAHTTPGGREAMREILESEVPFTAVVASNDLAAVGAWEVLSEAGLSVPDDVALIGFDDRVEAKALVPQLTTVHYPIFEVGYQALLLLLRHLQGEVEGEVITKVPTRLVVRESCGCLPGEMLAVSGRSRPSAASPGQDGPLALNEGSDRASVVETMAELVYNETHALNLNEVQSLCTRLVRACRESLSQGDTHIFRRSLQRILEYVAPLEDGLQGWQAGISALRQQMSALQTRVRAGGLTVRLSEREIEDMLHQACIAIDATAHGQRARETIRQAGNAHQIYEMTARFQTAQEEADIMRALADALPDLGIDHVAVALYEAERDDPVAWSVVRMAPDDGTSSQRIPTREFPPPGLYAPNKPFHLALTPLFFQGNQLAGFVAFDMGNLDFCAHITWLLAAALRGLRLYRAAVEGRRLAEEANRLKGRFLSMVSHELRTPLNLISGLSDLLLRESKGEASAEGNGMWEDLERIYVNAQHLDDLLRDVLDLARSEVGELHLTHELLDLDEVLEPICVIAKLLVQEKSLTWRTEIPEVLPSVWGDRTRLRQVLLNLVNNAVKFTDEGEILLRVTVQDESVSVSVKDTGLGIPPEEQSVIFDEFRQSERSTARGYGGLGLGLAICRRLIEMHGGEIGVRSSGEEGAGSEFHFTLPIVARPGVLSEGGSTSDTTERVVLLVGDLERARELRGQWSQDGFELVPQCVEGDGEWLNAVLAASPSAVILDEEIAAGSGWETLKVLKQNREMRRVPVLFLGGGRELDHSGLLEVDYLTKPMEATELGEALVALGLLGNGMTVSPEKTILVVDDDLGVLDMHTRIVQSQSPTYRVLQARDGYEALDIIQQTAPDLVLLDLMMPRLDGFGVLKAMRERPESRSIPVIILTAQTLAEEDMARLNRGMVSVLSKGLFTEEEALTHLESVLARQRKAASDSQGFVLRAMAYIHTHYMNAISRSDIAGHVGVSERHLTRCFHRETGVTPISYLNRYRVKQARYLLEAGKMGITDIAMAVGFSSGGYFSRVFRQEMGVSPLAYQRGECDDSRMGELS
ncbi:MAG: substrate-binding domain-containing protein [Anaerolineae bacterium]